LVGRTFTECRRPGPGPGRVRDALVVRGDCGTSIDYNEHSRAILGQVFGRRRGKKRSRVPPSLRRGPRFRAVAAYARSL